jgi:hypothetical protein
LSVPGTLQSSTTFAPGTVIAPTPGPTQ